MNLLNQKKIGFSFLFLIIFLFSACDKTKEKYDKIYESLKDEEAKVIVKVEGEDFYRKESIFKGGVILQKTGLNLNLFDQFESNLVMNLGGDNWYVNRPVIKKVSIENGLNANVFIGKMIDKSKNQGKGLLMTEGKIEVTALSDTKIIIVMNGKVGRYMGERDPAKWNNFEAYIVYKKPKIKLEGVTPENVYY